MCFANYQEATLSFEARKFVAYFPFFDLQMVFQPVVTCFCTGGNFGKPQWLDLKENEIDNEDFGTRKSGRKVPDSYND